MNTNAIKVDLRSLVGEPKSTHPILVSCPCHPDPSASLAVYADHAYCYAMRRYFRRYESAALLLGVWDGKPETVGDAVKTVRPLLGKARLEAPKKHIHTKHLDQSLADTFQRYLLACPRDLGFFKSWRGLNDKTIHELKLGFTGSHFTIPVFGWGGELLGMRYRMDPRSPSDGPKYSGVSGYNSAQAYSIKTIRRGAWLELWVFEGEYDAAVGHQLGLPSATITNGAGSLIKLPEMVLKAGIRPHRWCIATDQDEAGDKAAWELKQLLGSSALRAHWAEKYKDITEFNKAGGTHKDILLT